MRHYLSSIIVALLASLLAGVSSCEPRIVEPSGSYVVVDNVLSPVRIRTSRLSGAGWIQALLPDGGWTLVHFAPEGAFTFDDRLPAAVWHCSNPGGTEGCVARLRIGHDEGPVGFNAAFGDGIVHVCTKNYVQRQGRRHCGVRELQRTGSSEEADIPLPAAESLPVEENIDALPEGSFSWSGDAWNRLLWGTHVFRQVDAVTPPVGSAAEELSGLFFDYRWSPDEATVTIALGEPSNTQFGAYSMDIGACSFFLPWEWKHRLTGAYYTAGLGAALDDRGLAERFLDEMIDTAEPQSQSEVNALLWVDGIVGIEPNESASPEFHYRFSESGEPQMCFKQYLVASSDISTKPDHWYRFDQAIGAFFLELLPFVGRCGPKYMSVRYCGTPRLVDGVGAFEIDQPSVHIAHQGYPWGKVLCNNQFVPELLEGIRQTFDPGGEGARQIDAGIAVLVDSLSDLLGLEVRRIELSPRGIYLVTAESTEDEQYGLGDCRPDLDRAPPLPSGSRPSDINVVYPVRGITRF